MEHRTPLIFVYRPHARNEDCLAYAYAEDGSILDQHHSSTYSFFRRDMGLHGELMSGAPKHLSYRDKYPHGYRLVEVIGLIRLKDWIDGGQLRGVTAQIPDYPNTLGE